MQKLRSTFNQIFLTATNTVPFMLGLFIGLMLFNADVIYNTSVTLLSGSTFHLVKYIGSNFVS